MFQHNMKSEKSSPNTFIDGVFVKISEEYKPPRKVVLPISCQNCTPGEALYSSFDFALDRNILNKLSQWKLARREETERRKKRLKAEQKLSKEVEHFNTVAIEPEELKSQENMKPKSHSNLDSILTPVSVKLNSSSHKSVSSNFNLSDFETDNSSPFDNMELKSINDMEILASILSSNTANTSFHNNNKNSNITRKDLEKTRIEVNNKNNERGYESPNFHNNMVYCDSENHTVNSSAIKDINQYNLSSVSEHYNVSHYGPNDSSNQIGATVSLNHEARTDLNPFVFPSLLLE